MSKKQQQNGPPKEKDSSPELSGDFNPDWASPTGDTIKEVLRERKMSEAAFATETGISRSYAARLLDGTAVVTPSIATRLAAVLGSTERFWLARDRRYWESLSKKEDKPLERSFVFHYSLKMKDLESLFRIGDQAKIKSFEELEHNVFWLIVESEIGWPPESLHQCELVTSNEVWR